jgi:hypothetical protein
MASVMVVIHSCSSDDETFLPELPEPILLGFNPTKGILGHTVTISGENFSPVAVENVVQFNGTPAQVQSASTESLTVVVPDSATTGKIKVTVTGKASTSQGDFTILSPTIEDITPMIGSPRLSLHITGTNFSANPASNRVLIGSTEATIQSSTVNELVAEIMDGSMTGNVTVKVGTQKSVSTTPFEVCDGSAELIISNIIITSTNAERNQISFSCQLTNVGNVSLDLTKMVMQNYVSADAVRDPGDSPAGGWILSGGGILSQGATYSTTWSSNVDYSAEPHLIVTVYVKDGETVNECNPGNNYAVQIIE